MYNYGRDPISSPQRWLTAHNGRAKPYQPSGHIHVFGVALFSVVLFVVSCMVRMLCVVLSLFVGNAQQSMQPISSAAHGCEMANFFAQKVLLDDGNLAAGQNRLKCVDWSKNGRPVALRVNVF